jgi:excisionase family DNA binding protein
MNHYTMNYKEDGHLPACEASGSSPPNAPEQTSLSGSVSAVEEPRYPARDWMTVEEFAAIRGVHHQTVRKAIKDGRLDAEDWGGGAKPLYRIHRGARIARPSRSKAGSVVPRRSGKVVRESRFASLLGDHDRGALGEAHP